MATKLWRPVANASENWATATYSPAGAPTAADEIVCDATSGTGTLTAPAGTSVCRSLDCLGFTGGLTVTGTISIGDATAATGNRALRLAAGMTLSGTGILSFISTNATQQTVTFAGKTHAGQLTFNGNGGSWKHADNWTVTNTTTVTRGSWSDGGTTWQTSSLASAGALTRSITASGTGTLTSTSTPMNLSGSGLTTTFTGSTLTCNGGGSVFTFNGLSQTFGSVLFTGSAIRLTMNGSNTFASLSIVPGSGNLEDRLDLAAGSTTTVTGTFTCTGKNAGNLRFLIRSTTTGTPATLTLNSAPAFTNVDFRDITGAGTATPFTGTSMGNGQGNTNITFAASVTNFLVGTGSRNWDDATIWASSTGGTGGTGRAPLPQDDATIDGNSGTGTVTTRQCRICRNLTTTNASITGLTFSTAAATLGHGINGDVALKSTVVYTWNAATVFLRGRGAQTWTGGGGTPSINCTVQLDCAGTGTYTVQDSALFNCSLVITNGTFTAAAGTSVTLGIVTLNTGGTMNWGSAGWTWITVGAPSWTYTAGTVVAGSGTMTIPASSVGFTFTGGGQAYGFAVHITGTPCAFSGVTNNSFGALTIDAGLAPTWTPATTTTFTSITVNGTAGSHVTLSNSSVFTWSCGGTVTVSYADVHNCTAAGASIPFHDLNGVDNGGNTNWLFDQVVTLTESLGLSDATAAQIVRTVSETLGLTDPLSAGATAVTGDVIGLSDNQQVVAVATALEQLGITDPTAVTLQVTIDNLLGLTDPTSSQVTSVIDDSLGLTDLAAAQAATVVAEALGLTDAVVAEALVLLEDLEGISDPLTVSVTVELLDRLGSIDAVLAEAAAVLEDALGLTDAVVASVHLGVPGCAVVTFDAATASTSCSAASATLTLDGPTAVGEMRECGT